MRIRTEEHGRFTVEIYLDTYAEDPREQFDFWSDREVENWENGEVYGYELYNGPEFLTSCWGFYTVEGLEADIGETVDYFEGEIAASGVNKHTENLRAFADGEISVSTYLERSKG